MAENKIEVLKTKNKQPTKAISYQDLYLMKETLEQLQSWKIILELLDEFFGNKQLPLDKKKNHQRIPLFISNLWHIYG
ncbi:MULTISPECIES: hypothetical protein [Carnobacterium]|uniref:hypothetical protein n=1 Tax=Carnobacterium TaxID=2747 RepID=UPI00288CC9CF|nr:MULTISPECIES: hypothetical protein [Carnobacterium]MDT1940454.1 hypothetical protein [Carnobacterium divergens]MDT1942892.1 hypothetical protein [Carnobacterium divergens]MDT1948698.1 hypothetical protein [Carnobacterium divergens]MDT1951179.1 hypothetical protein [Carnobacterium divergens]MDT1956237.1 hypothetical protein [Carnobacterium divergens]